MKESKNLIRRIANALGIDIYRISKDPFLLGVERYDKSKAALAGEPSESVSLCDYVDRVDAVPRVNIRLGVPKPHASVPVIFTVFNGASSSEVEVLYSHLTLLKFIKHYDFKTVLDIGSHAGMVAQVLRNVGAKVTTVEISPGYEADHKSDYLDTQFPEKFDAIWCSQILEHQRNAGRFLDKVFDDLKDGGVLALTVPHNQMDRRLQFGHCNLFSPLLLIYHLVLAGFDCSEASLKCFYGQIGLIVRKRYNGIKRHLPQAALPVTNWTTGSTTIDGRTWDIRELLGDEVSDSIAGAFPPVIDIEHATSWKGDSINWGSPI